MKRAAWLWLLLLLGPAPQAWSAGKGVARVPELAGPVSKPMAVVLKKFARAQEEGSYPNGPDMAILANVDVNDPEQRRLFAPLAQGLRDAECRTPKAFRALKPDEKSKIVSVHAGNTAVNAVIAEVHRLRDAAEDEKAGVAKLSKTAAAIELIREVVEVYTPYKTAILASAYDKTRERLSQP